MAGSVKLSATNHIFKEKIMRISLYIKSIVTTAALLFVAGCSGSSSPSSSSPPTTSVNGIVMAGPADKAAVTVKTTAGAVIAGPVITGADGSYSIAIPSSELTKDLVFEATGGTFTDEATSPATATMGTLSTHVTAGTLVSGATVAIDPSTTIIQKIVASGKTKTAAESYFSTAFGYTPDSSVKPAFAGISSASTTAQRLTGLRAAAFSQLAKNLGISASNQFALINAIAADLADGTLDGGATVDSKTMPPDISNTYGQALIDFQQSSNNKSKLTADQIGAPVFNKIVYTDSYKAEFIEGSTKAATGKTSFKLKLTNRSDNSAATGKTLTLKPFMYMSTKSHTTPVDAVVESATPGTYDCTAYYVMSTGMAGGVSMGVWKIDVMIGTETATFFPDVAMNMGTTPLTKILGIDDKIMGMAGVENRTWFLFDDGIMKEGMGSTYTVKLFTATKAVMTSFPSVYVGKILKNDSNTDWTINTMLLEVSSDKSAWIPLSDATANGHWSVSGITPDMGNKLYVRLIVNGEQKTTDGKVLAPDGSNGYQTFTLASGSMSGGMTP